MSNYKKHLLGGSITYVTLMYVSKHLGLGPNDLNLQAQALATCLIGALFPDIDTKSKIQKYTYSSVMIGSMYFLAAGQIYQAGILATLSLLPLIASHRGLFHRLWFIL